MERLNYNQLYYFYVVASEGSIKGACEKLHLTQPTISGQLKTLEESLGFQLFDRKYRRLELNEKGKSIYRKAEKIFTLGEELLSSLPGQEIKLRQDVNIGVSPSLPNSFVREFTLTGWKDPHNALHLLHSPIEILMNMLDEGRVDFILSDTPYHRSTHRYHSINLGSQELWAVATEEFKKCRKNFPHSLHSVPFLAFGKQGQIREDVDYFFKINNIRPDVIGSVDDAAFIRMMTEKGLCVSILPARAVQDAVRDGTLIKVGTLKEVMSNRWIITSPMGSKKIALRRLLNNYLKFKKRGGSA